MGLRLTAPPVRCKHSNCPNANSQIYIFNMNPVKIQSDVNINLDIKMSDGFPSSFSFDEAVSRPFVTGCTDLTIYYLHASTNGRDCELLRMARILHG